MTGNLGVILICVPSAAVIKRYTDFNDIIEAPARCKIWDRVK